jgi:hypothetical protein
VVLIRALKGEGAVRGLTSRAPRLSIPAANRLPQQQFGRKLPRKGAAMESLEMSESDRAHLRATQALAIDAKGREILVGLTREESEWLLWDSETRLDQRVTGTRSSEDRARALALQGKHEAARLRGISLTNANPAGNA